MSKEIGIIGNVEVSKASLAETVKERGITIQESIQEDKSLPFVNPYIDFLPMSYSSLIASNFHPSFKAYYTWCMKKRKHKQWLRKSRKLNRK